MASLHVGLGYHGQKGSNEEFPAARAAELCDENTVFIAAYFCEVFRTRMGLLSPVKPRTLLGLETSSG
jgi:hypothetical protein